MRQCFGQTTFVIFNRFDRSSITLGLRPEHVLPEGFGIHLAFTCEVVERLGNSTYLFGQCCGIDNFKLLLAGDKDMLQADPDAPSLHTRRGSLRARTPNQAIYLDNIAQHDITLGIGPAGTGKTYLAVAMALSMFQQHKVKRIVLTRPAVRIVIVTNGPRARTSVMSE